MPPSMLHLCGIPLLAAVVLAADVLPNDSPDLEDLLDLEGQCISASCSLSLLQKKAAAVTRPMEVQAHDHPSAKDLDLIEGVKVKTMSQSRSNITVETLGHSQNNSTVKALDRSLSNSNTVSALQAKSVELKKGARSLAKQAAELGTEELNLAQRSIQLKKGAGALAKHQAELGRWTRASSLAAVASLASDRSSATGPGAGIPDWQGMWRWQELIMVFGACLLPVALISCTGVVGKLPQVANSPELLYQGVASNWEDNWVDDSWPPMRVMIFASIVVIGVSANIAIILPSAPQMSASAGWGLLTGGYGIGALAGLFFFARFPVEKLWSSFRWQAGFLILGNACLVLTGHFHNAALFYAARLLVGFAGGCMYNAMQAYAYFAKGSGLSSCLMLAQFFIALGLLMGPALACLAVRFGHLLPEHLSVESLVCGTMSLLGAVQLLALLVVHPPSFEKDAPKTVAQKVATPKNAFAAGFAIRSSSTPSHYVRAPRLRGEHFALVSLTMSCAVLRVGQCLLFDNGVIVLLEEHYGWSMEASGYSMCMVGLASALTLYLTAFFVAGSISDAKLMWYAEVVQISSVALLLFSTFYISSVGPLLLVGSVVYCASTVWGGASMAFCLKRQVSGSKVASLEKLLVANQLAILLGIVCGSIISSILLVQHINVRMFALLLLVPCILQPVTRVLSS